jgi:hypothetical protein
MAGVSFRTWFEMRIPTAFLAALFATLCSVSAVQAQKAPELGYIFPPGAKAGTTVDVHLGGYDWTPDMEYFVHDKRVRLIPAGPPGPIFVPGPPYWFGAKGRIVALPLPREVPAKLVIPPNFPPGPMFWQAANANGCTAAGVFMVGGGPEVVEDERRHGPQLLSSLPATVSGRLMKNEEVDRYRFTATKDGPLTCVLCARQLGAKFLPMLDVRDSKGRVLADASGANGTDPGLTFAAKAGAEYVVSIHDVDFGGDRSYVYRLTVTPGPRVLGAVPAAGRRGETREVEFVGIGVATGAARLETVKRRLTFPANDAPAFEYRLETPWGIAPPFRLLISDLAESIYKFGAGQATAPCPIALTGTLDQPDADHRHILAWKKGEVWSVAVQAQRIGSPLDVALAILGPDGKELARNDDLPGTTDAGLDFTVPADGTYRIVVNDMAGKSGTLAAIYRLVVERPASDFTLQLTADRFRVPIGGKLDLPLKAVRKGGFQGPIAVAVTGLPAGVTVPAALVIPAGKNDLIIPLQATKTAAATAGLVSVSGTATVSGRSVTRTAVAATVTNLVSRASQDSKLPAFLLATTLKPVFKGRPVDQDTGRKVHRGSTFPADVIVERLEGFQGEIILQMAAQQSYQVQGITGGEVKVPPGVTRAIYPCFMPEWLETTRTSRMGMVGVAKAADPTGKIRYQVGEITGFVTMTMEGALLKVSAEHPEMTVPAGQAFDVRLKISRLTKLAEPVRLELRPPEELAGRLKADPVILPVGKDQAVLRITPMADLRGPHTFVIRGTAVQDGKYPAISEGTVTVDFN